MDVKRVKAFAAIERSALMKLNRLDAATALSDLAALPGNRFVALAGDRKGQYSIRINDKWRICFEWPEGGPGPSNVEIVDYHQERTVTATAFHPGEHLAEELKGLQMSAAQLARNLGVPTNRITAILNPSARRRATPPCVWLISSAPARNSGSTCNRSTTSA